MNPLTKEEVDLGKQSGKIAQDAGIVFNRGVFFGFRYLPNHSEAGFGALEIHINGIHPEKTVTDMTRMYRIEHGEGRFIIDGTSYPAQAGDIFLICDGSRYEYQGNMQLFEINVPFRF